MTKFKLLSLWAKKHKWKSRFIIILSFIGMNILGIVAGSLFRDLTIRFSPWLLQFSIVLFSVIWLSYPDKKQDKARTYGLRKTCDAILFSTTFVMFLYFGNRQVTPIHSSIFSPSAAASSSLPKDSAQTYKSLEDFKKSLHDESGKPLKWKERKKLLKQQVKAIKKDKSLSDGGKAGLIILCCLLAIVLTYGVAALSCSLSCSGSEGAAVAVAVFGLIGVGLITFFLIRGIVRKPKRERERAVGE